MDSRVNEEITDFVTRTGRKPEEWRADWNANYNIAPTQQIPVLIDSAKTGELRFDRPDGRSFRRGATPSSSSTRRSTHAPRL